MKKRKKNSIRRILLNKKYIGVYTYQDKETPNAVPRIIDDETFMQDSQTLEKNKKAPARTKRAGRMLFTYHETFLRLLQSRVMSQIYIKE
jgi:hypothetical protein